MKSAPCLLRLGAFGFSLGLLLSGSILAQAEESKTTQSVVAPLPTPLTLHAAMQAVDQTHPDLIVAQSRIELSNAQLMQADSAYGFRAFILGEARYIEPSRIAFDQSQNDSRIALVAQKRLYDFGRTANAEKAALAEVQSSKSLYQNALNQYRIAVLESFFKVLLADLQFIRDNEAMSIAFVNYDRTQMRNELGQRSDIELFESQSEYQRVRRQLYTSRSMQRNTRSQLANVLNRPGELVADIMEPELPEINRPLPEVEALQEKALADNPMLIALRAQVEAAEKRMASARAGYRPTLAGEALVSEQNRTTGNYNEWEASLILNVPLLNGGKVKADVAQQQAELIRLKAELRKAEMDVQQAVLENWQLLDTLKVEREEMKALLDYRDLYLDRSRALYEMEVKTDLGDSMVEVSEARLKMAKAKFNTALTWARLDALIGNEVYAVEENKQ
ncbi:MAG: TolC family protein [Gammaproteobacteria bacterium]|nr:TolC family protein [Gammaproteobacteria bacterium]